MFQKETTSITGLIKQEIQVLTPTKVTCNAMAGKKPIQTCCLLPLHSEPNYSFGLATLNG